MTPIYLREATLTYRTVKRVPRDHFKLTVLASSETVYRLVGPMLEGQVQESLLVLAINNRNAILGYHEVAIGSHNRCYTSAADVFRFPLTAGAAAIVLVHNHPSGSCEPSTDDIVLTRKLVYAGEMLGIAVLDHLIVGDGTYFSMLDAGIVDFKRPAASHAVAE